MSESVNPPHYQDFDSLKISGPDNGVLTVVMSRPGRLTAADAAMHRQLADVWPRIDADPDVRVVIVRGEGKGFSAGGDLDLVSEMAENFETRARVWREARDLV